jgi:hypothetical protein
MDKRNKLLERLAWHERTGKLWRDAGNLGHAVKSEKAAARRREELAALDLIEGNQMITASMLPPRKDWELRAKRGFTSGSTYYPRGSTVPLEVLETARNGQSLLDDRLEWRPPGSPPGPQPRPIVAAAPATFVPDEVRIEFVGNVPTPHCAALAEAMRAVMAKGRTWAAAKDLTDYSLRMRATKEFVDAPHFVDGVRTGVGTQRRVVNGFWSHVATLCREQEAA